MYLKFTETSLSSLYFLFLNNILQSLHYIYFFFYRNTCLEPNHVFINMKNPEEQGKSYLLRHKCNKPRSFRILLHFLPLFSEATY